MQKIIIANWKMNGSLSFLKEYFQAFPKEPSPHKLVFCPPFPYLEPLKHHLHPDWLLGAQDCSSQKQAYGAYTGDVSATMLKDVGCDYVIVGHSERRHHYGEPSERVLEKAEAALEYQLTPIVCVGETLEQRTDGKAFDAVLHQLKNSLPADYSRCLIAYEPVWAIGTGRVATLADITEMVQHMRDAYPEGVFVYGGSVTEENAADILALPNVDGLLVGGASLQNERFRKIVCRD